MPDGARLEVRYELSKSWVSNIVEFEREPRSLRHPFRRSIFIYTGFLPFRVLVRDANTERRKKVSVRDRVTFYGENNFSSYPEFHDVDWSEEDFAPFFFLNEPEPPSEFVGGGGEFGGAGATGDWKDFSEPVTPEMVWNEEKAKPTVPSGEQIPEGFGFFPIPRTEPVANDSVESSLPSSAPEEEKAAADNPENVTASAVDRLDAAVAACADVSELTEPSSTGSSEKVTVSETSNPENTPDDNSEPNAY